MQTYPASPLPSWSYPTGQQFKTLISDFDSGAEQRRQLLRFSKRDFSLAYKYLSLTDRNTMHDFFRSVHGASDAFWYKDFTSRKWSDEYVGRGYSTVLTGAVAQDSAEMHALLHLNGATQSTTILDEYGHTWTMYGNAQLLPANPKFGVTSLFLDGTNSYIESTFFTSLGAGAWTIEGWFRFSPYPPGDLAPLVCFLNGSNYGVRLEFSPADSKLHLYLSSDGSTWGIANNVTGSNTTWQAGVWYKYALVFNGSAYKLYVGTAGGTTQDISVTSASTICGSLTVNDFGKNSAGKYFPGYFDEIRVTIGQARYSAAFTPETLELPFDGGMTDETTKANDNVANDMTLLPAVPNVGDCYYFIGATIPDTIVLNIGTAGNGTWTITWEYWKGTWSPVQSLSDGTNGFKAGTGKYNVTFNQPVDALTKTIKGITGYPIRARVSAYTSVTTQPKGTQAWLQQRTYDIHGLSVSSLVVYIDGIIVMSGYNFLSGSGQAGADQIQFTSPPPEGCLITSDFNGYLRMKARLTDDTFQEEMIAPGLFNVQVKVKEVQW